MPFAISVVLYSQTVGMLEPLTTCVVESLNEP